MKLDYPKQFLEYEGKPLFLKSLMCAEESPYIKEIIIVTQKDNINYISEICKKENLQKIKIIVEGGKKRQDSVYNALKKVSLDMDYVIIQDAVRPFCKEKYFKDCYDTLQAGYDGAVIGVSVKDTIKILDSENLEENKILSTPKREKLFAAHTPQIFKKNILEEAYKKAYEDNFYGTDDSSLVERLGFKVKAILGDYDNVKITVPEDLKFLFRALP
ncbi:MAG: 2-C-methyl-D-erythritol 4-phosphate cytidylyltransferase [Fusobacteriales bacterium]|nr:MAG: 2-C-methyl-D-erythritol 4-phosphate cytidylyltransferase [Fusobacteriales bacterium]